MNDSSWYQINVKDNHLLILFKERPTAKAFTEFEKELMKEDNHKKDVIVDFAHVTDSREMFFRSFVQLSLKLKAHQKRIRLVSTDASLLEQLKRLGINSVLPVSQTVPEALKEVGLANKQSSLDVNFINPFLQATINVLQIQTHTASKPGQISRKNSRDRWLGDISGVIGIVNPAFSGAVVISFPSKTFLTIMSRMLGEEFPELTKEIEDGAGELTNIIFGQAKTTLNSSGYAIQTALPSVVTGRDHAVLNMTQGPTVIIPFSSDAGDFFVEICMSN